MHVEGDELVYDPVTCASCGTKVREDRPRCLRCGEQLVSGKGVRARRIPIGTFALVPVCLALVGAVVMMNGGDPGVASAAAVVTTTGEPRPAFAAATEDAATPRGYQDAVATHPQDAEVLNNLGQSLVRSGRAREAIEHFDKAIAIAGDRWAYHFNRARAYAELEEWDPAIAGYGEAAALFPDDYVTQFNLGRAFLRRGDVEAAVSAFARTVELAPGEPDFSLAHAGALDRAGRPAEAAAAFRRYLELDPAAPQAEKIKARIAELEGAISTARP